MEILTERLIISPMSADELRGLIEKFKDSDADLSMAYSQMLDCCLKNPEQHIWFTSWKLLDKSSGVFVGDAGFKGLTPNGSVEIGYGIVSGYEGKGYATEAVEGLCAWAFSTGKVEYIEAETEASNAASQRVLFKNGFVKTGKLGEEGPRFILKKS